MKVAICYSGVYREFKGWRKNHEAITQHADAVFYSTWEGHPLPPVSECITFIEPTVNYNPVLIKEFIEKYPDLSKRHVNDRGVYRWTKQILGHQSIVEHLPSNFDVIIRMRYDTWLGNHDWLNFILQSYQTRRVIGFGNWSSTMDNTQNICDKIIIPSKEIETTRLMRTLTDFMIIHPAGKMKGAYELHKDKKLFCANKGWYQVLVEPYKDHATNYGGGVMLTRHRKPK